MDNKQSAEILPLIFLPQNTQSFSQKAQGFYSKNFLISRPLY
jgi:hypothetical protein